MTNQLNIIQHNVQNYATNKKLLHDIWADNSPDVILLNSTGLMHDDVIQFPNYSTIQTPQQIHSGSAILVKNSLRHRQIHTTGNEQLLAVNIFTSEGIITLSTFYRVFDNNKEHHLIPHHAFNKLFQRKNPVFFLGDLNLNLTEQGYKRDNSEGKIFKKLCQEKNSNIHHVGPTFNTYFSYGGKKKGRPDIIFTNSPGQELNQYIEQGPMCGSDHTSILFAISSKPIILPAEERFTYNKANWKKFQHTLNSYGLPNVQKLDKEQLDIEIQNTFDFAFHTATSSIPKSKTKTIINVPPKSINTEKIEICLSNIEYEIVNHKKTDCDLLESLKATKRELNLRLRETRDQDYVNYYQNLAKELDTSYGKPEFWDTVNKLKGNVTQNNTCIELNNERIEEPQAVVNGFRTTWKPIFASNPIPQDITREEVREMKKVESWCTSEEGKVTYRPHSLTDINRLTTPTSEQMRQNPTTYELNAPIVLDDLKFFIRKLKNKKASGESGISNRMIKKMPDNFLQHLTNIFNAALSMGYFPKKFKRALTIMIPKKQKSKLNPINYRPISLLEPIAKLFESIINRRIKWYLEDTNLLHDCQFGFRPNRSTHTSLHVMTNFITNARKRGLSVYMLSKDVEKAFDKVYLPALIYKIHHHYGLPPLICKTLTSFLCERSITIKVNGHTAEPFTPKAGVPQGSVLGPLLYLMYINDVHTCTEDNALNMYFADDNVILVAGKPDGTDRGTRKFREIIQKVTNFERINRIKVNPTKSVSMVFDGGTSNPGTLRISLNPIRHPDSEDIIPHQSKHTILGITFDSKLNFKKHVKTLKGTINSTIRKLGPYKHAGIKPKTFLYKSILQSKILYSNIVYPYLDKKTIIELQKCQNAGIYKFIYNQIEFKDKPNAMNSHVQLKLKSISQICYEAQRKFYKTLSTSLPFWYKKIKKWSTARPYMAGNADHRPAPIEFARASRPTFYYSDKHII